MGSRRTPRTFRNTSATLESLETRRLLAQISVLSHGAVANDGQDDRAAIIATINASAPGDTILFPSGTYNISDQIMLKGAGRIYQGQSGTILQGNPANDIFHIQEDNTKVDGFTFNGKPIMIDRNGGGMVAGVVITNNTLNINATGPNSNGVTFTTGLSNSNISYNTFNLNAGMGVYGYYWNNLTVANNTFQNGVQGMHVDTLGGQGTNMLIEQNIFTGISRMGVEYQGGGSGTILQDNWFEKPNLSTVKANNGASFAFSIVADRSSGTIARRNVIYETDRPDGIGVRIGFETGGDGTLVENNYVYGINQVLANTDGLGTTSCLAQNNYYSNVLDSMAGRGLTQINNGPQVNLQWLFNRGKAGRYVRFTNPSSSTGVVQQLLQSVTGSTPTSSTPSSTSSTPAPAVLALPSGTTFLSDMAYTVVSNGYGPVEKDHSNGEAAANDGHTITLNGAAYAKGLGVNANSEIDYNLNGKYAQFFSDIGIDDEEGANGSVDFQIWLDGVKVYDPGVMTAKTLTKSISLNVAGKNTMKLIVTNAGDNSNYDHADWANARLSTSSASTAGAITAPSSTTTTTGTSTWLSALAWTSAANGYGPVEKDHSNGEIGAGDGHTITLRGKTYAQGLGVHAASDISYALGGKYTTFATDMGIDDEVNGAGSVDFQVYVDGVLKYDSGIVHGRDAIKQLSLSVAGAQTLRLVVNDAGDGNTSDHADWAGAKLTA